MKPFRKSRAGLVAALLVIIVAGTSFARSNRAPVDQAPRFRSAPVDVGDITQTVTATGTINPVALINVGSQVSGTVIELKADFNDHVKKGQVLLKLDPTIFNAQIAQAEASQSAAEASRRLAQATFERNEGLVTQNYISALTLDQSRRELDVTQANVKLAQAQLARARADLDNSIIRSPIDGVIIKRTIDIGQTVAAAFSTPNLFQIAKDLTRMQIDTNVSEADVGALKSGQAALFSVDAYPDKEFTARMRQFRLAANVVQNVVTYNVVLDVDNDDELLKPGMTAQVKLVVGNRSKVLRIPTAALRFRLSDEDMERESKSGKKTDRDNAARTAALEDGAAVQDTGGARLFKIYKLDEKGEAAAVDVKIGISNFRHTEILPGPLVMGDRVIVRTIAQQGSAL